MSNIETKKEKFSFESPNEQFNKESTFINLKYILVGILFGIVMTKAEVMSWFRIQEMFRFQAFHMYGVMGVAVFTGIISIQLIKYFNIKTLDGEKVVFHDKTFNKGHVIGGFIFGLGWAVTGACPGPLFAQIGSGYVAILITLASAIFGTWIYGYLRNKLPH